MAQSEKKEIFISSQTREKVQSAKLYIQRRYSKLLQQERQKKNNWQLLYKKMQSLNLSENQQELVKLNILHKEAQQLRQTRKKLDIRDFQSIKIIGKGAFGQVRLCRWKQSNQPVAIKKMKKSQMVYKNKVMQARQQKDILANSQNNPWIVELKCSFQDDKNLYLVMEYLPGGDLMNLLIKKDIFTQEESRFYIAQILVALDTVHKMNYIHRDLKPDNILIDKDGHIKLSDFGLCKHTQIRPKKLNEVVLKKQQEQLRKKTGIQQSISNLKQNHRKNRKLAYSAVGTPDYVAPEVQNKSGYTQTVDWWSMGIILFQMLVGYPPFISDQPSITWHKILNWRKNLVIPKQAELSNAAIDLIRRLINDQKDRIGINGVQQIKAHPFFSGVDWKRLRQKKAPYIPQLKNSYDTRNFDLFDQSQQWYKIGQKASKKNSRKDVMFIGYTFKKNDNHDSYLLKALLDLETGDLLNEINKNTNKNLQALYLQKPRIQFTQQLKKKIFKKQKERNQVKQLKDSLQSTQLVITNRNSKKIQQDSIKPALLKTLNFTNNKSNEHSCQKPSPGHFLKQKQQSGKKISIKSNLRINPIILGAKKK